MWSVLTAALLSAAATVATGEEFFNSSLSASACVCTTVPCPVSGKNTLTEGGGSIGTYYYSVHNGYPVVTSASVTITKADMDKVYLRDIFSFFNFLNINFLFFIHRDQTPPAALKITPECLTTTERRTATLGIYWHIDLADRAINLLISFLRLAKLHHSVESSLV